MQKACLTNTKEARKALVADGGTTFRQALSLVYDYRDAVRTANPYSISVLAYGDDFVYQSGVLCYVDDRFIRILNIHDGSQREKITNTCILKGCVGNFTEASSSANASQARISLLSFSDNVLVGVSEDPVTSESWLFVLDVNEACDRDARRALRTKALQHRLTCTTKLFVRQTGSYLYCGTHSGRGRDGHHEWLVQGFSLITGQAITSKPIQLTGFVGSEVGSTAAFAIHNGAFYAVTNQTSYEVEEVDWTSYYHCLSFPLDERDPDVRLHRVWRRQHVEGPINDSWTDLSLQSHEHTAELLIIECRKEWLGGGSASIRTYYTQAVMRPPIDEPPINFGYPADDPLTRTLDDNSKPSYEPARARLVRDCHSEYPACSLDASRSPPRDYILARSKYRTYNLAASSFVDLVSEKVPLPNSPCLRDRIRLRVVSRTQKSPLVEDHKVPGRFWLRRPKRDERNDPIEGSEDDFNPSEIHLWPPDGAPSELFDVLCPGGCAGQVKANADERSIVYMIEPPPATPADKRAIILVNFDPTWRHPGMKRLNATPQQKDTTASVDKLPKSAGCKRRLSSGVINHKNLLRAKQRKCSTAFPEQKNRIVQPQGAMWEEDAMYLSINQGFWLR